jgi:tyrosinase
MTSEAAEHGDGINRSREDVGDVKHRKGVSALSVDELAALREAFRKVMKISDSRGYGHFASIHGLPDPGFCEHRSQLFLPWHRGYLYFFEQALQDVAPGVTIPWWDWTASAGLPDTFAEEQDAEGRENPLTGARIVLPGGLRDPSWPEETSRAPSEFDTWLAGGELPTQPDIDEVLGAPTFDDLIQRLENKHNAVHMWVGGEMQNQGFAAFDPLFWAHHAMVDRLWAMWQNLHPGATPRREHLPKGLNYFKDMTVEDTLDITDLGYDYALAEVLLHTGSLRGQRFDSNAFPVRELGTGWKRADLELNGVDPAVPSYEGRIFLNNPQATEDTSRSLETGYVGSFHVFGKDGCWGEEGHCHELPPHRKFDRRRASANPQKIVVTMPEGFAAGLTEGGQEAVFSIVVGLPERARRGDAASDGVLRFERLSVVTYA